MYTPWAIKTYHFIFHHNYRTALGHFLYQENCYKWKTNRSCIPRIELPWTLNDPLR